MASFLTTAVGVVAALAAAEGAPREDARVCGVVESLGVMEELFLPNDDPPPGMGLSYDLTLVQADAGGASRRRSLKSWTAPPQLGGRPLQVGDCLCFTLPAGIQESALTWNRLQDPAVSVGGCLEAAQGPPWATRPRRLEGLEALYFEPIEEPASVVTRSGGSYRAAPLRRLLPPSIEEESEMELSGRRITDLDGPTHMGLQVRDFVWPGLEVSSRAFLRQVIDGTHPRLHNQYWALYLDGIREDLWYFAPYEPERGKTSLAPLQLDRILAGPGDGEVVLRVAGSVARPMGITWSYGTDLVFDREGDRLKFRHAVRRYAFRRTYPEGVNGPEHLHASVEEEVPGPECPVLERWIWEGELPWEEYVDCLGQGPNPDLYGAAVPSGSFSERVEILRCLATLPDYRRERRDPSVPSFLERGGRCC